MGFVLFFVLAALMIASAIGVVVARHPVRATLSLVVTLFLLAVFFVFLDADFVAALQIVVYAGAIMVVFLFVIMLLNQQDDPTPELRGGRAVAAIFGASVFGLGLLYYFKRAGTLLPGPGMGTQVPTGFGTTESIGLQLFTQYLLQFEITGLLMLAAVIGAVVLAKRKVG
jgi:NADH-quinone oxidoreductase subunit J